MDVPFDSFVAVSAFLCAQGGTGNSVESFVDWLAALAPSLTAAFIWPTVGRALSRRGPPPPSRGAAASSPWTAPAATCDPALVTAHLVGWMLELEAPRVHAALATEGVSVAHVVRGWLDQCFLNYLDWPEIQAYLFLTITEVSASGK